MDRSVCSVISSACGLTVRACSRRRNSSSEGAGELGRVGESAVSPVEGGHELLHGTVERVRPWHHVGRRRRFGGAQLRRKRFGRLRHLRAFAPPDLGDLRQHLGEPRAAPLGGRRKVGAAVKRLQLRRQPDAHRPPARAGGGLDKVHVDAVDIGTFLAIDLDGHEVLVENGGDGFVLERFVLHHVAPVAGRVSDREKDRLVLLAGPGEGVVAPRKPVDRIAGVLEKVRAAFVARRFTR